MLPGLSILLCNTLEVCFTLLCSASWLKTQPLAGRQWLTPVILATQEAEIRRIMVQSQPQAIV
jgi:hypothetical protein